MLLTIAAHAEPVGAGADSLSAQRLTLRLGVTYAAENKVTHFWDAAVFITGVITQIW